jgi:hypothetical protein
LRLEGWAAMRWERRVSGRVALRDAAARLLRMRAGDTPMHRAPAGARLECAAALVLRDGRFAASSG